VTLIRPELRRDLHRWREVIAAGLVACAGLWFASRGGWLPVGLGLAIAAGAAGLGVTALRRLRFGAAASAPGVIEIDEGQIGWYGPGIGGFVSLDELSELGLVTVAGLRCWRLRQADGQVLLIPVGADGAESLFDALTALPGIDGGALLAALEARIDRPVIWRRTHRPALT